MTGPTPVTRRRGLPRPGRVGALGGGTVATAGGGAVPLRPARDAALLAEYLVAFAGGQPALLTAARRDAPTPFHAVGPVPAARRDIVRFVAISAGTIAGLVPAVPPDTVRLAALTAGITRRAAVASGAACLVAVASGAAGSLTTGHWVTVPSRVPSGVATCTGASAARSRTAA